MDRGECGVGGVEIQIHLILAIAVFAEQIHIRRDGNRQAGDHLPLEAALAATEDVELGAGGAQRAAETAHAQTAADRELPRVAQRDVIRQVDHVGGNLVTAGGAARAGRNVMLGVGDFIFQAPTGVGPGIADRNCTDGIVGVVDHVPTKLGVGTDLPLAHRVLAIPATTQARMPAIASHGRRAESRGGNGRHGEQTKLHFSTLAENPNGGGTPPISQRSSNQCSAYNDDPPECLHRNCCFAGDKRPLSKVLPSGLRDTEATAKIGRRAHGTVPSLFARFFPLHFG